jgi:hypothetical protein
VLCHDPFPFGRPDCDAVDEEMITTLFQHGNPDVAVTARQEPHLAAPDPRAIILLAGNGTHPSTGR